MDPLPSQSAMEGDSSHLKQTSEELSNVHMAAEFTTLMDPPLYEAARKGDIEYLSKHYSQPTLSDQITTTINQHDDRDINNPSETSMDLSTHLCVRTINQDTVLHIATLYRNLEFAKIVVQHCPQLLLLQNSSGDTPLHIAARSYRIHFVEFFLSPETTALVKTLTNMVLTKMLNKRKDTPLHCAARDGYNSSLVELLVKADNEVCSFKNNANEFPLHLFIVTYCWNSVEVFIQNAPSLKSHKGQNGLTELHVAVIYQTDSFDMIKELVEWQKEMIREGDDLKMTPLHYAAFYGKIEIVELFIEYDKEAILCTNNEGQSALYVAAFNGHLDVLVKLIECRPDCHNMVDNKGRTALHAGVLGNQPEVVKFFKTERQFQYLIKQMDNDGNTPLHLAAHFKFFKIIKLLQWNGKKALNHDSRTPFDLYNKHFYKQDLRLLEGEKYAHIKAAYYYLESVEGLRAKHEFVNSKLKIGNIEPSTVKEKTTIIAESTQENGIRRIDFGEESALEVNLLVGMLVATVTFAAGFTVPGGLVDNGADKGLATLTKKPIFKAFVVFNTLAFCCSIFAVLIHFGTSLKDRATRIYYKEVAAFFTALAIIAMVFAFCFGTSIVLTKSTGLYLAPYFITASFLILYPLSRVLNRWIKLKRFGKDLGGIPFYIKARLFMEIRNNQRRNQSDVSPNSNEKKSTWCILYKKSTKCLRNYLYKISGYDLPK